jgi:catechol 2,3-dioxygenase-like lactoylglutathione lyase family enzyme
MAMTRFDHINILAADIDVMRDFLVNVLGVRVGPRPPFASPGYWLYDGDVALLHISHMSNHEQTHVDDIGAVDTTLHRGSVDHLAFRFEKYGEVTARLRRAGIAFHEADVPYASDRQVFVDGPNNITLELLFTHDDVVASGGRLLVKS